MKSDTFRILIFAFMPIYLFIGAVYCDKTGRTRNLESLWFVFWPVIVVWDWFLQESEKQGKTYTEKKTTHSDLKAIDTVRRHGVEPENLPCFCSQTFLQGGDFEGYIIKFENAVEYDQEEKTEEIEKSKCTIYKTYRRTRYRCMECGRKFPKARFQESEKEIEWKDEG